jgi:lysophospholipase L1-like esterase
MKRLILTSCMAALLAAPAMAQVDLSRYVALGDSLTAGFASGSLMDYYQLRSYPALIAERGGTPVFEMPLIAPPGLAPALELKSLSPLVIGPTDVLPPADPLDYFYNVTLEAPYQNMAIPGSDAYDLLFTTGNIFNLLTGNTDNVMHDLILRTPEVQDPTTGEPIDFTALVAAISQQPTLVTVWIGNNDALGAVLAATAIEGVTMTPVDAFALYYNQAVGALAGSLPNADIVVFPVFGDVAWVPFATTLPNMVEVPGVGVVQLQGENGPIEAGDYLTLGASALIAQGYGLPLPGSPPLPEDLSLATGEPGVILRAEEVDVINGQLEAFNQIIAGAAAMYPNVHFFDMNSPFAQLATGTYRTFGGIDLSLDFLVGGVYSYDGVHPQNIGQGVVAYELIEFLNRELGAGLPQVDMHEILTEGGWQAGGSGLVCVTCDPKQAVLTDQAFKQVYELFLPDLARRWRQQVPGVAHSSSSD